MYYLLIRQDKPVFPFLIFHKHLDSIANLGIANHLNIYQMKVTQSPPPPPSRAAPDESVEHSFLFTGSVREYFSIWIVNVALTIITLGFYSPWAKVRRERYLMSHTELAGVQFEYTADPWKIFKGRLILFAALIVITKARAISWLWILIAVPLFALGWPWVISAALRFRARYTSYRNLSFHFAGTAGEAFTRCVLPKVVAIMTLWLLAPWARLSSKRYAVNNLKYGVTSFKTPITLGQMYRVYAVATLLFVVGALIVICGIATSGISSAMIKSGHISLAQLPRMAIASSVSLFGLVVIAWVPGYMRLGVARRVWDNATIGSCVISCRAAMKRYFFISLTNTLLLLATLGFARPWCVIRVRRFILDNLAVVGPKNLDDFAGQARTEIRSVGEQAADVYDLDVDFGF